MALPAECAARESDETIVWMEGDLLNAGLGTSRGTSDDSHVARLLLVDLDNTLIDRDTGFDLWTRAFLRDLGKSSEREMSWLRSVDEDGLASRESFFSAVRRRYDLPDSVGALVKRYKSDFPPFIPRPTDETLLALQHAKEAGLATCIVTNGSRDMQERKIAPLAEFVDGWVISQDVGLRKPDPAILLAAAERVGRRLTPEAWLIGDRPETDVWCAVQAGIRSAWVSQGGHWDDGLNYRPTIQAATFGRAADQILDDPG